MAYANVPCRMEVQMQADKDNPAGHIVILEPGWQEVPPELADHPVVSKLVPKGAAGERASKAAAAKTARDKAIEEANAAYQKVMIDNLNEEQEEYAKEGAEPSPDAQHARIITGGQSQSTPTASMTSKVLDPPVGSGERARIEEGHAAAETGRAGAQRRS